MTFPLGLHYQQQAARPVLDDKLLFLFFFSLDDKLLKALWVNIREETVAGVLKVWEGSDTV